MEISSIKVDNLYNKTMERIQGSSKIINSVGVGGNGKRSMSRSG